MHVLLLRPVPGNDRFGLGPFFRIEPLGLEYIAAALEMRGHRATVVDLRYVGDDDLLTYLVGSIEERSEKYDVLSTNSPIGMAILGDSEGNTGMTLW